MPVISGTVFKNCKRKHQAGAVKRISLQASVLWIHPASNSEVCQCTSTLTITCNAITMCYEPSLENQDIIKQLQSPTHQDFASARGKPEASLQQLSNMIDFILVLVKYSGLIALASAQIMAGLNGLR